MQGAQNGSRINEFKRPLLTDSNDSICSRTDTKGFPADLAKVSRRKLRALAAALKLEDLRQPPSNHLEALRGDRAGQHSIRVNDKWRLCFVWRDGDVYKC
jgi:proteic killer suppression protein